MSKSAAVSITVGFESLLTLLLVAAKLWDRIDWPWWGVCAPLWLPLSIVLAACLVIVAIALVGGFVSGLVKGVGRRLRGRRDNGL